MGMPDHKEHRDSKDHKGYKGIKARKALRDHKVVLVPRVLLAQPALLASMESMAKMGQWDHRVLQEQGPLSPSFRQHTDSRLETQSTSMARIGLKPDPTPLIPSGLRSSPASQLRTSFLTFNMGQSLDCPVLQEASIISSPIRVPVPSLSPSQHSTQIPCSLLSLQRVVSWSPSGHRRLREHRGFKDFKESKVPLVQSDPMEMKGQMDRRDHRDFKACKGPKVRREHRAIKGHKELKVIKVLKVRKELLVYSWPSLGANRLPQLAWWTSPDSLLLSRLGHGPLRSSSTDRQGRERQEHSSESNTLALQPASRQTSLDRRTQRPSLRLPESQRRTLPPPLS